MARHPSSDRLEHYTRMLVSEGPAKAKLFAAPILPEEKSLFRTIDALWRNLQRQELDPAFKDNLHVQLLEEAKRKQAMQHLGIQKETHLPHTPWLASAAMVGAAATLAGAYAYWRWNASRQAA